MMGVSKPTDSGEEVPVRVVDRRWWARPEGQEATEDEGLRKPTYVEELERRLEDQAAQLQTVLTERRRSVDEFEQVKARIRREVTRDVDRAKRLVLAEFLDVVDNLDRALASARDETAATSALIKGVELVREQFLAKLASFGVTRIGALGEPFDAARHEAISTAPVDDPALDNHVVAVVKEGYTVGDDLLRPASVVVGRA